MVTNGTELKGYATLFTLLLQIVLPSSAVKLDVDKMQVGAYVYYFCPINEVVSRRLVKTLVIKTNKYPSLFMLSTFTCVCRVLILPTMSRSF